MKFSVFFVSILILMFSIEFVNVNHISAQVGVESVCLREWTSVSDEGIETWQPYEIDKAIGWLDLRSNPQHGNAIDPGMMIVTYDSQSIGGDTRACFGSDIDRILTTGERMIIRNLLNHNKEVLPGTTFRTAVRDFFSVLADPSGQTATKPLMPKSDGTYGPLLAPFGRLYTESFTMADHHAADFVLAVLQEDYKRLLSQVERLELNLITLRKIVGGWKEKYRLNCRDFVPDESIDVGCQSPTTIITESWTGCADSDSLNCDLTWTELTGDNDILSNRSATSGSSVAAARADSDLSSDDHFAQGDIENDHDAGGGTRWVGVIVRKDSSATETYYTGTARYNLDRLIILEITAGSRSQLASPSCTLTEDVIFDLKFEIDGSDMDLTFDGGSCTASVTDATITSNVRVGIDNRSTSGTSFLDNFRGEDLAAPPARRRIILITKHEINNEIKRILI